MYNNACVLHFIRELVCALAAGKVAAWMGKRSDAPGAKQCLSATGLLPAEEAGKCQAEKHAGLDVPQECAGNSGHDVSLVADTGTVVQDRVDEANMHDGGVDDTSIDDDFSMMMVIDYIEVLGNKFSQHKNSNISKRRYKLYAGALVSCSAKDVFATLQTRFMAAEFQAAKIQVVYDQINTISQDILDHELLTLLDGMDDDDDDDDNKDNDDDDDKDDDKDNYQDDDDSMSNVYWRCARIVLSKFCIQDNLQHNTKHVRWLRLKFTMLSPGTNPDTLVLTVSRH